MDIQRLPVRGQRILVAAEALVDVADVGEVRRLPDAAAERAMHRRSVAIRRQRIVRVSQNFLNVADVAQFVRLSQPVSDPTVDR